MPSSRPCTAALVAFLVAGAIGQTSCVDSTEPDFDASQDADPEGKADGAAKTCAQVRCGNEDAPNILFPGNPVCYGGGCERGLAGDDLFVPPRNGAPWGDTYELGTLPANTLSGYSSGRIALLRRLAMAGDGAHAVMLDPSWEDGARDFAGRGPETGASIVKAWLQADDSRSFLLVYSTRSVGWASYAALRTDGQVGTRVRVCSVDAPHLLVPAVPNVHDALVDPDGWNNGHCK